MDPSSSASDCLQHCLVWAVSGSSFHPRVPGREGISEADSSEVQFSIQHCPTVRVHRSIHPLERVKQGAHVDWSLVPEAGFTLQ